MRIIGGRLKGHKLHTFRGRDIRPTPDRVREALFNILSSATGQAVVLDLFAGTGALGIEAVSRGARSAVFIDCNAGSLEILHKNVLKCRVTDTTRIIRWDIAKNLDCLRAPPQAFNLVLMDPPYARNLAGTALKHLLQANCLANEATIVVEHEPGMSWDSMAPAMSIIDLRRYGKTELTFISFTREPAPARNRRNNG